MKIFQLTKNSKSDNVLLDSRKREKMKPKKLLVKEEKSGELQKLKRRIKKLEKENARLKSDIRTLEGFREETSRYIDGKLDGVPVERVIRGIEKKQTLKQVKEPEVIKLACPKCISAELKEVAYPGGKLRLCPNCKYREAIKK